MLSFPDDDGGAIGDIAIAYETVIKEAAAQEKSSRDHLLHLVIHGVLHLLGHDHLEDGEAMIMEGIEAEILAGLALPIPIRKAGLYDPETRLNPDQIAAGQPTHP